MGKTTRNAITKAEKDLKIYYQSLMEGHTPDRSTFSPKWDDLTGSVVLAMLSHWMLYQSAFKETILNTRRGKLGCYGSASCLSKRLAVAAELASASGIHSLSERNLVFGDLEAYIAGLGESENPTKDAVRRTSGSMRHCSPYDKNTWGKSFDG